MCDSHLWLSLSFCYCANLEVRAGAPQHGDPDVQGGVWAGWARLSEGSRLHCFGGVGETTAVSHLLC